MSNCPEFSYYEYVNGKYNKFWRIMHYDGRYICHSGRRKRVISEEEAKKHGSVEKVIALIEGKRAVR